MAYNSYHSNIKIAASLDILPNELKRTIPKSSLNRFRNTDFSSLLGYKENQDFTENITIMKEFLQSKTAIKLFTAALRIRDVKISILSRLQQSSLSKLQMKAMIITAVNRVKDTLGQGKVLRFFGITSYKYHSWSNEIKHKCIDSPIHKCMRLWPNQLSKKEVTKMKSLLTDPAYSSWSITSLAYYALKNNTLSACVSTWYKYAGILGITRSTARNRRKDKKTGIRAAETNKIWHMDVTVFKTMDNVKAYIHILMDNFSRYILNYRVSLELRAQTTFEMLKESYYEHIHSDGNSNIELITDGGPENNNNIVNSFIEMPDISIKKLTALVDINFSNSMIESYNKLLKYRFYI